MSISYHVYLFTGYRIPMNTLTADQKEKILEISEDDNRNMNGKNVQLLHDQMCGNYVVIGKVLGEVDPSDDCGEKKMVTPQFVTEGWQVSAAEEMCDTYPEIKEIFEKEMMSLFMISHAW